MRRFKDLSSRQKKNAVEYLFKRVSNQLPWSSALTPSVRDKVKNITTQIKFCGCLDCQKSLLNEVIKDNELKEIVLAKAQVDAENAYYPEPSDTIVKVI